MKYTGEEIGDLGSNIYKTKLRDILETEENIGKIVSIDVLSGDFEIADDLLDSGMKLRERRPDAEMYGKRIGYNAVYTIGGKLVRTVK